MIQLKAERAFTYDVPFVGDLKPYAHQAVQLEMVDHIFREQQKAIIWNEAMTGAGKTLANYSYLVRNKRARALGIYPVNELVKDQFASVNDRRHLPLGKWDEVAVWTAEELQKNRMQGQSKLKQMMETMGKSYRAILSNPDHLMMVAQERLFSYKMGEKPLLFYHLLPYTLQIFDEFHLYDIAQVNFLIQWIALLQVISPNPYAFLLSSATPRAEFFRLAENLGLPILRVQEEIPRWEEEHRAQRVGERIYLEPLQLEVKPNMLEYWGTYEKIIDQWADIEKYLQEYPQAKGLIILDSIHEAQMLAQELRDRGYQVGEVHGLSDREHSRQELGKQITVATATVEVGVDFKGEIHKDFLIFEARDAGSFMQRLGRIGRGSREKPEIPLCAWVYTPYYVAEQLNQNHAKEISREELKQQVINTYRHYQDFFPYIEKVGGMNLVHAYYQLRRHEYKEEQTERLRELPVTIEQMYGESFTSQNERYKKWKKQKVLEPVLNFRGSNTMEHHVLGLKDKTERETFYPDIWFWDESIPGKLRKYDFNFLLRRRHVEFISKEEMIDKVKSYFQGAEREEKIEELKKSYVLGYAEVLGIREKAARFYWDLPFRANSLKGKLVRFDKLTLKAENDPALSEQLLDLFSFKEKKSWIVFISPHSVKELTERLHLPPMFRVYPARTTTGREWSIAFNSEAFQLWSVIGERESEVF